MPIQIQEQAADDASGMLQMVQDLTKNGNKNEINKILEALKGLQVEKDKIP